jgi:H+/gluconate symporter-like permease
MWLNGSSRLKLGPCVNDAAFCMFEEYFNAGLAEAFKT